MRKLVLAFGILSLLAKPPTVWAASKTGSTEGRAVAQGGRPLPAVAPLAINSVSPTIGKLGDRITLTGTGFVDVEAVTFNGIPALSLSVLSPTTLVATVPLVTPAALRFGKTMVAVLTSREMTWATSVFTVIPMTALTVTPQKTTLILQQHHLFHAIATFSDQGTLDVTSLATWESSNPIAVPVFFGNAEGRTTGTATLTASLAGLTVTSQVRVIPDR